MRQVTLARHDGKSWFPHPDDPGDAGWHVDLNPPGEDDGPNEKPERLGGLGADAPLA
jgi:hypothetical protein